MVRLEYSPAHPTSNRAESIGVARPATGRRPEGYEPPSRVEVERVRTQVGVLVRTGRRPEGPSDLNQVLERYLGENAQQKRPEGQRQGGRRGGRNNNNGQGRSKDQPRQQQGQPRPAPQREAQPVEPKAGQGQNHKKRYRPHHRRKSGGGQGQPPQG